MDGVNRNTAFWIPLKEERHQINKRKPRSQVTFQDSIRSTLFIGQILSLFPVVGVFSNKPNDVRFVLTSWKIVYALISFAGQTFITIIAICNFVFTKGAFDATTPVSFYLSTYISMVIFFKIAKSWPYLVQQTTNVEVLDPSYDKKLIMKCNVTCAVILSCYFVAYGMKIVATFVNSSFYYPTYSGYERYLRYSYRWVFNIIPYSTMLGLFVQLFDIQARFIWNYHNLFIDCISFYLISRLNHVNKKLLKVQGKYLPGILWRRRREDFERTTRLVRTFSELISGIVFIIFAKSVLSICIQLFGALKNTPLHGYENSLFCWFSVIHFIVRFVVESLIVSEVYSASMVAAPILYEVPSPTYCVEVQRFLEQVNKDTVALTGLKFFTVTRGLLLKVAAIIVTYELVMLQFIVPQLPKISTMNPFNATNTTLY